MNTEVLANAIIELAVQDYRWARSALCKASENFEAMEMRSDTEEFFRSAWFGQLTQIDGEWLLRNLAGECA